MTAVDRICATCGKPIAPHESAYIIDGDSYHYNHYGHRPSIELPRVETGVVQFDADWPGVFIRGDDSFMFARALGKVLKIASTHAPADDLMAHLAMRQINGLLDTLNQSNVQDASHDATAVQHITRKA